MPVWFSHKCHVVLHVFDWKAWKFCFKTSEQHSTGTLPVQVPIDTLTVIPLHWQSTSIWRTYILTVYLSDFVSENCSDILAGISSDNCLTIILTFYLDLSGICSGPGVPQCIRSFWLRGGGGEEEETQMMECGSFRQVQRWFLKGKPVFFRKNSAGVCVCVCALVCWIARLF